MSERRRGVVSFRSLRRMVCSWPSALADIAARLKAVAAKDPQRILPYSYAGTMGWVQGEGMAMRVFHKLGASLLDRTICSSAGLTGLDYTLGGAVGMDVENFAGAKLIVIWGSNSITSNLHFWAIAQEAKRRGAKLIAIDPYRSDTALKCHQHIALRPGTDSALALAIMHQLINDNLLDHDYIARHTVGFEQLKARAAQFPAARAAKICGITVDEIVSLAREYGAAKPAAIRLNYGMQRTHGGSSAVRAIASLPALIGAWRDPSGGVLLSGSSHYPLTPKSLTRPDLLPGWPARAPRTINMSTIGDALLQADPPIEALIVYNSNPVAVAPESEKVIAGFGRDDLFTVVLEHFQTDTADYADYLLPATTQLEHFDLHKTYGHRYVVINQPAIAPLGQARSNAQFFRDLARELGFTEPCFSDDDEAVGRSALDWNDPRMAGASMASIADKGWFKLAIAQAPYANGGFPTPSGKCEFYSERLAAAGLEPVPDFVPPYESVQSNPALAARYPLALISPPARHFMNSTFVNVDSLRKSIGEPQAELNPIDAQARGIVSGDRIRIFNDRGSFLVTANVSDRARDGVVVAWGVWWQKFTDGGRNVNAVTSQALTDMGRGPTFYDCLTEVEKVAQVAKVD